MTGGWAAVGEMADEVKKDESLFQEVIAMLTELKGKTKSIRTVDEIRRRTESLLGDKKKMGS